MNRRAKLRLVVVCLYTLDAEEARQEVDRRVLNKPVQGESAPEGLVHL